MPYMLYFTAANVYYSNCIMSGVEMETSHKAISFWGADAVIEIEPYLWKIFLATMIPQIFAELFQIISTCKSKSSVKKGKKIVPI